jgi:CheY-like chemotaxis protein
MSSASSTSGVITVVEPHADNRAMYQTFLELKGWDTSSVETARDALARLRIDPRPHAVIFDVVLPDMNPLAFCEAMETLVGEGPAVRRIIVTGWLLSPADREELTRRGVTGIYEKPCDLDALLRALRPWQP